MIGGIACGCRNRGGRCKSIAKSVGLPGLRAYVIEYDPFALLLMEVPPAAAVVACKPRRARDFFVVARPKLSEPRPGVCGRCIPVHRSLMSKRILIALLDDPPMGCAPHVPSGAATSAIGTTGQHKPYLSSSLQTYRQQILLSSVSTFSETICPLAPNLCAASSRRRGDVERNLTSSLSSTAEPFSPVAGQASGETPQFYAFASAHDVTR